MQRIEDFKLAVNGEPGRDYFPLAPYMNKSYLDYSLSVILQRAIPDVRDGLKPVHRRILYAMSKLNLAPHAAHKKSARVVGDVIGKYHPHGDASVYEAMVLMAQAFHLRHPLIDGQGNWGSLDGDSPAAMRYTECRMSEYSKLLLEEIDKDTVDFRPNYDGNDWEPAVLPARVPMALLNDQMGIAVGMASDIPAHNLGEVVNASIALFRNPNTTLKGLLRFVKGPDFPCGGQITSSGAELEEFYRTGRGMISVRARYEVKEDADGWHLVFTELPPRVSPEQVLLEIEAISNPQPRKAKEGKSGKGDAAKITPEQKAAKDAMLARVSEVSNGAGNDTGPVYLEVFPKSARQKPADLANYLFSVTSLESKVKANMNLLNLAGLPAQMGLLEILKDWNRFRFDTVTRRCKNRLEKVEARLHLLEGLLTVLADIDEVIRIIRSSDDDKIAKARLMERWSLSDPQADKILDMKLRQLTRLDEIALRKDVAELEAERAEILKWLGSDAAMTELIISELKADAQRFGTPRRTVIEEAQAAIFEEKAADEPLTVILSQKGWIRSRVGHGLDLAGLTFKDGDARHTILETRSAKQLLLLDENGRAYTVAAALIPGGRGDGVPLATLVEIQEKAAIVSLFAADPADKLLLASTIGYGFVTAAENLLGRNKAGKVVLNVDGGKALPPIVLPPQATRVAACNSAGFLLVFELAEIGEYPKGKGNKLLHLKKGETLGALVALTDVLTFAPRRGKNDIVLKGESLDEFLRKRGSRGRLLPKNALPPGHGVQLPLAAAEPAEAPAGPEPQAPASSEALPLETPEAQPEGASEEQPQHGAEPQTQGASDEIKHLVQTDLFSGWKKE